MNDISSSQNNIDIYTDEEIVDRIFNLNDGLRNFWDSADGWAPLSASELLSRSRLDWQVSLSDCLRLWLEEPTENSRDGYLILAWVNLGSLVEGTMKLLLSIYYQNYQDDVNAIQKRNGEVKDPDILSFEQLRQFTNKIGLNKWDDWLSLIQRRRNAIHAFQNRDIGSHEDFFLQVRKYLLFLREINNRLPYPDDIHVPCETRGNINAEVEW